MFQKHLHLAFGIRPNMDTNWPHSFFNWPHFGDYSCAPCSVSRPYLPLKDPLVELSPNDEPLELLKLPPNDEPLELPEP